LDLLPPGESDAAFFLSDSQLRKRYTAALAREVEGKRELILMCLAAGFPVEDIAKNARVNYRTVQALAARDGERVAGELKTLGRAIRSTGARWYALARTKEGEATFIQLATAASYALQRSNEIEVIAGMGEVGEEKSAIASAGADPCARLRELLAPKAPAGNQAAATKAGGGDASSENCAAQAVDTQSAGVRDAGGDAGEPTPVVGHDLAELLLQEGCGDAQEPPGPGAAGAGGGSQAPSFTENLDASERPRNLGKGDPS
jgi:hypothetical protein